MNSRLAATALLLWAAFADGALQAAQRSETRAFPISSSDTVIVQNDYGRVRILAGSGTHAEVTARRFGADERRLGQVEIVMQKSGDKLFLQAYFFDYQGESVDFEIRIPPQVNLVVWGANPGVELDGLSGYVRVQTLTGGVAASNLTGPVSILSDRGSIEYQAHQQPLREARLETVWGDVECHLGESLNLRIWLRAGGELNWNRQVKMSAGHMERQLGDGGPLLYAASLHGDVRISLGGAIPIGTPVIAGGPLPEDSRSGAPAGGNSREPAPNAATYPAAGERSRNDSAQGRNRDAPPDLRTRRPEPDSGRVVAHPEPVSAQQPGDSPVPVFRADVNWIYLNASVRDRRTNRAVANLQSDDFLVYEDGLEQQIQRFESTEAPINLLLLLDVSGSTRDFIDLILKASIEFTREIKSNDRIAVATFNSRVRLVQDFSNDRSQVARSLRGIRSGGGTAFYDALDTSIRDYMRSVEGRKAIVVFTDGVDNQLTGDYGNGSTTTFPELFRSVQEIDTTIYNIFLDSRNTAGNLGRGGGTVGVLIDIITGGGRRGRRAPPGIPGGAGSPYDVARQQLEAIADQTGGRLYSPRHIDDLRNVYSEIADDLRVQYTLAYVSSNPEMDGAWREIEVEIRGRRDAVARSRRGYYASPGAGARLPSANRFVP
ncbi:MAG: VWA domain-containing protein [Acidobacteriota bacterium]